MIILMGVFYFLTGACSSMLFLFVPGYEDHFTDLSLRCRSFEIEILSVMLTAVKNDIFLSHAVDYCRVTRMLFLEENAAAEFEHFTLYNTF